MEMDVWSETVYLQDKSFDGKLVRIEHDYFSRGIYLHSHTMEWMTRDKNGNGNIIGPVEEEKRKHIIAMIEKEAQRNPNREIIIG